MYEEKISTTLEVHSKSRALKETTSTKQTNNGVITQANESREI
jgi:hypothetical protein